MKLLFPLITNHVLRGFIIVFLFLFYTPLSLAAADPIAQVVWVKGTVKAFIIEGKDSRVLQRRSLIYEKDTIISDKKSTGQIVFSDNSLLSIDSETTFRIDEYKFGKDIPPEKSKFIASLVKGGFRTVTGIIPKNNPDNYQVKTPVATIGVRGTSFAAVFKGQLYMKYMSGSPCVTSGGGSLCMGKQNPFAKVDTPNSVPVSLAKDPGVFNNQPEIIPASFKPSLVNNPTSTNTTNSTTTPSGITTKSNGTISPKNNSFCIQ